MILPLFNWFRKPYPLIHTFSGQLAVVIGFGAFTLAFLVIYEPFDALLITESRSLFLAGFGLSVSLALSISYLLIPRFAPRLFDATQWQIGKEIGYLLFSFLLVSGSNFIYNSTIGASLAPQHTFLEIFGITFSVGIIPVIITVFITEIILNRKNLNEARRVQATLDQPSASTELKTVTIRPEGVRSQVLALPISDFLFARSDNNYSTVFYRDGDRVQRELIRLSLKKLEEQLTGAPEIIRCHRSVLVNKARITQVQGNARSLSVRVEGADESLPVSRNFSRENFS